MRYLRLYSSNQLFDSNQGALSYTLDRIRLALLGFECANVGELAFLTFAVYRKADGTSVAEMSHCKPSCMLDSG